MRRWKRVPGIARLSALSTIAVQGALREGGRAAFERREDTMKRMGRMLYLGIGRVVKGAAAYGRGCSSYRGSRRLLAGGLDRTWFAPNSDAAENEIKLAIFAAGDRVDQLIAAVRTATAQLVPPVKTGDQETITAAYAAAANASHGRHAEFRNEE
jgi:hypothetical protein